MKKNFTVLLLCGAIFFASSCASIVSKSSYPFSINSTPSEATITITDRKGIEVYRGNTPATMQLRAGSGYFSKARYQVTFEKQGFDKKTIPVEFKVDGWYFGNILFGGIIGMLIIDPATGAMYKLDTEFINEGLIISTTSTEKEELKLFGINEIPNGWKSHLVSLDQ